MAGESLANPTAVMTFSLGQECLRGSALPYRAVPGSRHRDFGWAQLPDAGTRHCHDARL